MRFYFDIYQDGKAFPDTDGFLYTSLDAAYAEANKTLRDILADLTLTRVGITLRDHQRQPLAHLEATITLRQF